MTLQRSVLVEAGHRCAIPTCRQTPVELAHIEPWAKVKDHTFENLIALCPTCHTRFDKGEIDRKSMLRYKANLTILNSRYGDLERRVLEAFAANPMHNTIALPGSLHILLSYLLQDGLLVQGRVTSGISVSAGAGSVEMTPVNYVLTEKGREFVDRWVAAQELK